MRLAIITQDGEVPISSDDLADEIYKRLPAIVRLASRGSIRTAIDQIERETKGRTVFLGPHHK